MDARSARRWARIPRALSLEGEEGACAASAAHPLQEHRLCHEQSRLVFELQRDVCDQLPALAISAARARARRLDSGAHHAAAALDDGERALRQI